MSEIQLHSSPLLGEIRLLIENSRNRIVAAVNMEMTLLYWNIGRHVHLDILKNERASYGDQIVATLSQQLIEEYGKGFTKSGLTRMIKFYTLFPDEALVHALAEKLSWSHFVELLGVHDNLHREFYYTLCINERWSVRQLKERMNSMLFERSALSKKPELTIRHDLEMLRNEGKMSVPLALKDSYILDFLGLSDTYSEKDIEQAILNELQQFILELGTDFAFLARQKRITVGEEDYYLDLLFFHRKLCRLIAIELKLGKFEAGHKSQMELYLKWLAKHEQQPHEQAPIGLILCADKNEELIQLLELDKQGIHVAAYYTDLPPIEWMRRKLQQAVFNAKQLMDGKAEAAA